MLSIVPAANDNAFNGLVGSELQYFGHVGGAVKYR